LVRHTETLDARQAARELLHGVMLFMRTIAAELRRSSTEPMAPAQFGTLLKIAAGPCTLSDLARHQAVSLPTVSKSIDALVRRGWIERYVDPTDRRQSLVRLTREGERVMADVKRRAEEHVASKLARLSVDERTQLVSAVDLLTRVISNAR
jgi:DNA-binding MarR family transcriptional regulator